MYLLLEGANQVGFVLVLHIFGSLLHWRRSSIQHEFGWRAGVGGSMERLTCGMAASCWSDPDGAARSTTVVRSLPCSRGFNLGGQCTGTHTIGFMGLGCVICWVLGLCLIFNGPVSGLCYLVLVISAFVTLAVYVPFVDYSGLVLHEKTRFLKPVSIDPNSSQIIGHSTPKQPIYYHCMYTSYYGCTPKVIKCNSALTY
ncbi:hypothetical protein ACLB2K_028039 [Fragaria x ananassa]